jgi:hypothetical protein
VCLTRPARQVADERDPSEDPASESGCSSTSAVSDARVGRAYWLSRPAFLDVGDVGGEKVDAVSVEVAAGAVVMLGGPRIGMTGEDLRITQRDAGIEGVDDGCMPQRVLMFPYLAPRRVTAQTCL